MSCRCTPQQWWLRVTEKPKWSDLNRSVYDEGAGARYWAMHAALEAVLALEPRGEGAGFAIERSVLERVKQVISDCIDLEEGA